MKHDMTNPCDNCPFRTDVIPFLRPARVEEIIEALDRGMSFPCHKTTTHDDDSVHIPSSDEQQCAGAMILLERDNHPTQMMRIHERLGFYDKSKLNMYAPVYASPEDMQDAYDEGGM